MLGTIPEYRRQGVASMLVGWGADLADRDGVEAFVDASDQGKPVYAKFDFEPQTPFIVPGETFACTCYLRPAKK
jgi:predicted N-acetyltransferase YhbS